MNNNEKQYIHTLFETGNFMELYQIQTEIINEMLLIEGRQDFEDFIDSENFIEEDVFIKIEKNLQQLYVDIDAEDNLEEKVNLCNQCLADTDYSLQLDYDDTYCGGVYFLSVIA